MSATSTQAGNLHVAGTLSAASLTIPNGGVTNAHITSSAGLDATKLEHQHCIPYFQADGTDVAAATVPVYICRGATAEIVAIQVSCVDAPSGGDKAFTVDLQKADEGTPTPATVLSSTISYSSTQSDCEVEPGTISSADLITGDQLLVVVAVTGSTGTQGQGLVVNITIREDAE